MKRIMRSFSTSLRKNGDGHDILERIPSLPSKLYYTYIKGDFP
jgi:hypothetical protein